jgi:4-hydroxybenzoate polyprenyltransferase
LREYPEQEISRKTGVSLTMNWNRIKSRLDEYEQLLRLRHPGGLLLLWPSLWALWLASDGQPSWMLVWVFTLGSWLMHGAGSVVNDIADRNFDPHVERTRQRPLAARRVGVREAVALAVVAFLLGFLMLLPFASRLLLTLAVGALILAVSYPFTKRFLPLPQAYLGVAFAFCVPMAYAAQVGFLPPEAWGLMLANVFWTIAYDTEYAMADRPDDLKIGIKTSAITFGRYDVLAVMLCYALSFILITGVGLHAGLRWGFWGGLLAAFALAGYHYGLIKNRQGKNCLKAFSGNNWIGLVIFLGIALDFLLRGVRPF